MKNLIAAFVLSLHDIGIRPSLGGTLSNFLAKHAPRLYCYLETPHLLWANVVMDTLIAVSYAVIFLCLMWLAHGVRHQAKFSRYLWVFLSFGVFILACGGTHLMDVVDLWWPSLKVATGVRILCAAASLPTAVLLARATPSMRQSIHSFIDSLRATTQQRDRALLAAEALATERREALDEVTAVNEQLHSVMNSSSDLILQIRHDWTILYGNRRASATLPDFSVGADFWRCFPGLEGTETKQRFLGVMTTRNEDAFSNHYEPYDKWYRCRVYPTQAGISIFAQDITAENKLEESLAREQLQREQHVAQLSHMAAGLAHEISNPLAIIHARASDLAESAVDGALPPAETVQKVCGSIVETADRAARILRGLKMLSREASKDPLELADIREIATRCVEMQSSRLERYRIAMRLVLPASLPEIWCREAQIGQIISNLLSNSFDAVVHDGADGAWISLEIEQRGDQLCIRVSDSGPEMPQDIRNKLMEPFFTTKPLGAGTGVGLSLSRAIAIDHGGSLTLLEGTAHTSFEVLLPVPTADGRTSADFGTCAA